jgi:hypothetical protein
VGEISAESSSTTFLYEKWREQPGVPAGMQEQAEHLGVSYKVFWLARNGKVSAAFIAAVMRTSPTAAYQDFFTDEPADARQAA